MTSGPKPSWWDYIVWEYDKDYEPIFKGLRKDTPKEIVEDFKRHQEATCVDELELVHYAIYDHEKGKYIGVKTYAPIEFFKRFKRFIKATQGDDEDDEEPPIW